MLADRLEATNQRVIDQSLSSVAGRVAATLLSQLEERLKGGGERRDVELFASPSDIATLAGTSREETVKLLHWLESEELLTVRRGRMIVHDPDALASRCASGSDPVLVAKRLLVDLRRQAPVVRRRLVLR